MLLNDILKEFHPVVKDLSFSERKHAVDFMDPHIFSFFSILLQLVNRIPYVEGEQGGVRMLDLPFFHQPQNLELYKRWEQVFARQQLQVSDQYAHLRDPIAVNALLDGSLFQCILDRQHIHSLPDKKKQQLKEGIWHVGNVLKVLCNNSHIEERYVRLGRFVFRNAFLKLRYLNSELVRSIVQFESVCDAAREKRVERDGKAQVKLPAEAAVWSDLDLTPWHEAVATASQQVAAACADVEDAVASLAALDSADQELVRVLAGFDGSVMDKVQAKAQRLALLRGLNNCSFHAASSSVPEYATLRLVGLLTWFVTALQPAQLKWISAYLMEAFEADLISEEGVA
ncbi:MAG: hypothetical protein EOP50_17000, partial [Sphingobacteriales bacterium]